MRPVADGNSGVRARYLVAYTAATAPATLPLLDWNEVIQMLSYSDLQVLAKAIADNSYAVWQKMMTLIGQIKAATTIATVQAVTW